tara:strand:- start:23807 stop:24067 length:261 start_codon:yes stop_codon:yes gene_type:complete
MIDTPIFDKIHYLSAGEGKLELHNSTGIVCASNDPLELAKAFITFGYFDSFRTSSSFDFGVESGFEYDSAVHDLFEKAFTVLEGLV